MQTSTTMALRLLHLLFSGAILAQAATAQLHKREDGLRCDARDSCKSWYTTGSAQCASGYVETPIEAEGDPHGTYCEAPCSEVQKDACVKDRCDFYWSECSLYPGNSICAKAMSWCDAPKAMPKASCMRFNLGMPVLYDDESGECAIDKNPDTNEHYLRFHFQQSNVGTGLYMSCAPVTLAGAKSVEDSVNTAADPRALSYCWRWPGNSDGEYELKWECQQDTSKFDALEKAAGAACASADYPGSVMPVFLSGRG